MLLFVIIYLWSLIVIGGSDHPLLMLGLWDLIGITIVIYCGPSNIILVSNPISLLLLIKEISLAASLLYNPEFGIWMVLAASISWGPFLMIPYVGSIDLNDTINKECPTYLSFNLLTYNSISKIGLITIISHSLFFDSLITNLGIILIGIISSYLLAYISHSNRSWIRGISGDSMFVILATFSPSVVIYLLIILMIITITNSGSTISSVTQFNPIGNPAWIVKLALGGIFMILSPMLLLVQSLSNLKILLSTRI